jgi:hypothetical protein
MMMLKMAVGLRSVNIVPARQLTKWEQIFENHYRERGIADQEKPHHPLCETLEKRSVFFKVKEDEDFRARNTVSILRPKI